MNNYGIKDGMSREEKREILEERRSYFKKKLDRSKYPKERDEANEHITILSNLLENLKNIKDLNQKKIKELIAFYKKEYKRLEQELRREEKQALNEYDELLDKFHEEKKSKKFLSERYVNENIEFYNKRLKILKNNNLAVWVVFVAIIIVVMIFTYLDYFSIENYKI